MSLADAAQPLYALPLDEFTAARNEQAKASEDKQLAKQLRALPKPSVSAWAVNMLVREHTDQLDEALSLGELLREAQQNLDRDQLVALSEQRRQLVAALARRAREVAIGLGHELSDSVTREVEQTLQAAMTDADAADAVRSGRLLRPLATIGLEPVDLADAVAAPGEPPLRKRATPRGASERAAPKKGRSKRGPSKKQLADAQRAVNEAERHQHNVQSELVELDDRANEFDGRHKTLSAELRRLQNRLADVESELAFAEREGRALERDRKAATDEMEQARRKAERALERLERLRKS